MILYFTYAADALGRTDLPAFAVPVAYVLIGACGLTALATGALAQRWGSTRVAAMCLATEGRRWRCWVRPGTRWSSQWRPRACSAWGT